MLHLACSHTVQKDEVLSSNFFLSVSVATSVAAKPNDNDNEALVVHDLPAVAAWIIIMLINLIQN